MFNYFSSLSPNTQKTCLWSSHFSPATASFMCLSFQQHFSKESIKWNIFSCPYHPFTVSLRQSGFQSPLTAETVAMLRIGICVSISSRHFSVLILWDSSCIDLIDQCFILRTLSASLMCSHFFYWLGHFSPLSFLLVPHPIQPRCRSSLQLDLCLVFFLIHTPMILSIVLISVIIQMPSQIYICSWDLS